MCFSGFFVVILSLASQIKHRLIISLSMGKHTKSAGDHEFEVFKQDNTRSSQFPSGNIELHRDATGNAISDVQL